MTANTPKVLEALRLPELYRTICRCAGIPLPPAPTSGEHFVFRSGDAVPDLLTKQPSAGARFCVSSRAGSGRRTRSVPGNYAFPRGVVANQPQAQRTDHVVDPGAQGGADHGFQ